MIDKIKIYLTDKGFLPTKKQYIFSLASFILFGIVFGALFSLLAG